MLGLGAKESGEEGKGLCADVGEGIEGEGLEDLEYGEEILLEPILEVPYKQVLVCRVRMK